MDLLWNGERERFELMINGNNYKNQLNCEEIIVCLFVCLEKETKVLFSIVESYQSRKFEERRTTQNGIIHLKVENTSQKKKTNST